MTADRTYLVDADVFIAAKNLYYSFDICPGFWKSVVHHHLKGQVSSVDRVRSELLVGRKPEDLIQWVKNKVPKGFFITVETDIVTRAYEDVMTWVHGHPTYFNHAKAKFAMGADGWLVACAHVHDVTVVTNEKSAPKSKKSIKLPDVCDQFGVQHNNTFTMLRALNVHLDWTGGS